MADTSTTDDQYPTKPLPVPNVYGQPYQATSTTGAQTAAPQYPTPTGFTPDPGHGTPTPAGSAPFVNGAPPPAWSQTSSGSSTPMGPMPAGIDPALWAIYQQAGVNPADRGSGFADWQYWQGVGPSQYARLASDLAGKGTDSPQGTPGSGVWQSSGGGNGSSASGGSGAYVPGQGVPGMGTVFGPGANSDTQTALFKQLMAQAQQSQVVDPNDPVIKAQTVAFDAQQQQANRNYLQQTAESAGANSNISAETRLGAEKIGQNDSAFTGQVMQQELTARRTQIQQALSGAMGLLTQEQQMQLQEELAQLGLAQQAYQYDTTSQFNNSPLAPGAVG